MKTVALLFAVLVLGVGCKSAYQEVEVTKPGAAPQARPRLETKSNVYVAMASDISYKKELVISSGKNTSNLIRDTFAKYVRRAYIARRVETAQEALETARAGKCNYLVVPTILRWADHSTEYTGIPDRLEVKIEVSDVETGELLHAVVLKGKSKVMSDGGDTPIDLLPQPVALYVASLFQVVHTPSAMEK